MEYIKFKNIVKSYNNKTIIPKLNFHVEKGSFTVLLGPSGCGKSTTLRILAGLEQQDSGEILINNKDVSKFDASKRNLSMVFQSYALFPHLSVKENILFGLKVRKIPKLEQEKRLNEISKLVGLEKVLTNKPSEISGGQKQRVALARAFISENKLCLMDEPLSNLDAKLRHEMRIEIKKLQQKLNMTVIYVTHDQTEAMSMADKIILMNKGEIQQEGTPKELYNKVKSIFVAKFIGTPPMNILSVKKINKKIFINEQEFISNYSNRITAEDVFIGIRPEDIYFSESLNGIQGQILFQDYHGSDTVLAIKTLQNKEDTPILVRVKKDSKYNIGDRIWINWDESKINLFDSNGERR